MQSGRAFDATTQLTIRSSPTPTPPQQTHVAPISVAKPHSATAGSSGDRNATPSAVAPAASGIVTAKADEPAPSIPEVAAAVQEPLANLNKADAPSSRKPDTPSEDVRPIDIAAPLPEETAELSASTQQLLDQQQPSRPAKTVHLPPQEVQEEKLREREESAQRRRSESEVKPSSRLAAPQAEAASSPSSTIGAHSAATPQPAQESPDTSPDSEAAVEVPQDLQPTIAELREKEEHDRLLEAQKEAARQQALGDVSTPDDQLKWEERTAAAREATERAAREDAGGPEPDANLPSHQTEAQTAVEEMEVDQTGPVEDAKSAGPATDAKSMPPPETQEDGDTIAVTRRGKPQLSVDTVKQQTSAASSRRTTPVAPAPPRMTTRVSSGAMRQKSVSEILGQERGRSQSTESTPVVRKEVRSPEPASPLTQRHHRDNSSTLPVLQTPPQTVPLTQAPRQPRQPENDLQSDNLDSVMDQLDSLKGAADDPEKDYLEPLFRIQAHEAPNSRTRSIPELIKMAPKALSTEDHYTSINERLDYRMLKRVYQLQNANRWSLRQMDKQKEPQQPLTHHDHMMEEMKWMRKDFKAERNMKKSVCAWLAQRCADWYHASADERKQMQGKFRLATTEPHNENVDEVPDLDAGDSAPEDDANPPTPREGSPAPMTVVVPLELADAVDDLRKAGKLPKALAGLPQVGILGQAKHHVEPCTAVSKFVEGRVLPTVNRPSRKRSRYDYVDEEEVLEAEPRLKKMREEVQPEPEGTDCALFDPIHKPIRDRLHSNNAFRPPSEFLMPNSTFYEFRSGSQWVWEDDQKLRKLAKDYSFNWSLIADEMTTSTRYKSAVERRTPWECFERWVDLESLPADMRKTVYFKTWYGRLESAQQASERRYQGQVQILQQQAAQNGTPCNVPMRRKTTPTRVEKRRSTRYLWMVDSFRKMAKKREMTRHKQQETARAAAQRKSQTDAQAPVQRRPQLTPQEFSKKRAERDAFEAQQQRERNAKMMELRRQQMAAHRAQQMQIAGGPQPAAAGQPRPPGANMPAQQAQMQANGQQMPNMNAQMAAAQQGRPGVQMTSTVNGHLAPPGRQGIPQAQMQPRAPQMAQPNGQQRGAPYAGQQYAGANGIASTQQVSGVTTAQQLAENHALLAAFRQQQAQQGNMAHNANQQINGSPSMPPPPTPRNAPQKLSSGHTPQISAITNQIRAANPSYSDQEVSDAAVKQLAKQTNQQSSNQARQIAMNAASGISTPTQNGVATQAYSQPQGPYNQRSMTNGTSGANGVNGMYPQMTGGSNGQQLGASMSPQNNPASFQAQDDYRTQLMRGQQAQMPQVRQMQSPNTNQAQLYQSPVAAHASPHMAAVSPGQSPYQNMNQMSQSSRSNTPMQRLSSSGSVNTLGNGGSPGAMAIQNSPRSMPPTVAQ